MGLLKVSASPHIRHEDTTRVLMSDVILAMIPLVIWGAYVFGLRVLTVTAVSVVSCVLFEYLWCRLRNTENTVGDLSAAVTGVLLAFNLPSTLPLYMVVIGAFVAIVITKELFGGIGRNFANPAIVGRIFLAVAFPVAMTTFVPPAFSFSPVDVVSSATPLAPTAQPLSYLDLLVGTHMGVLGETSALALLLGFAFLLYRPVVTWHIPVAYVGTVAVLSLLTGRDPLAQVLEGGLLLGAIYMATDYTTSPATRRGKLIFGVGCGLVTCLIRFWGNLNEGVAFSILFMNLWVSHIDALTRNTPIGGKKKRKGGAKHE